MLAAVPMRLRQPVQIRLLHGLKVPGAVGNYFGFGYD